MTPPEHGVDVSPLAVRCSSNASLRLFWRRRIVVVIALGLVWGTLGCSGGGDDDDDGALDAGPEDATVSTDGRTSPGSDASDDTGPTVPMTGPAELIDMERARNGNLDLGVASDAANTLNVGKSTVYKVDFTFTGRGPAGAEWTHRASLLLPTTLNAELTRDGAFAITQGDTANPTGPSQPSKFRTNYGAAITARLGIPTLLVSNIPGSVSLSNGPGNWRGQARSRCYASNLPAQRYTPCLLRILRSTGDLEADPFHYVAASWIRTLRAASRVGSLVGDIDWEGNSPPDVQLDRAVIMADGVRAVGARMAAAVDVRIDGVFGHASFARIDELMNGLQERWSSNFGWFDDPAAFQTWLQTDAGGDWRSAVDPAEWSDLLQGKSFVLATSTNDPHVPLGAINNIENVFPDDTRKLVAGGSEGQYAHGIGSPTHLAGWRGFIAHVYFDAPWNTVRLSTERDRGSVDIEADVRGDAPVDSVKVASVKRASKADDRDFRDTTWRESELSQEGMQSIWTGSVAPIVTNYALYTQVYQTIEAPSILEDQETIEITSKWASSIAFNQ